MNILEIYKKYQIMPQLQEHQFTVAAVAQVICENITPQPPLILRGGDGANIVAACLLHDMGNIIKFDLTVTQKLNPEFKDFNLQFWQGVKDGYIKKYGTDEHQASIEIARELGASARVVELIDCIGFNSGKINAESSDFGRKICAYSDMRVMPQGVCLLEERLADLRVRYDQKFHQMGGNEVERRSFEDGLRQIERQIFSHCKIKPEEITQQAILGIKESLKNFEL